MIGATACLPEPGKPVSNLKCHDSRLKMTDSGIRYEYELFRILQLI